jgi:hypothetical protein
MLALGIKNKTLEPKKDFAFLLSSMLDLVTPKSIGIIFIPWVVNMYCMVASGGWTNNPIPVYHPFVAGGIANWQKSIL